MPAAAAGVPFLYSSVFPPFIRLPIVFSQPDRSRRSGFNPTTAAVISSGHGIAVLRGSSGRLMPSRAGDRRLWLCVPVFGVQLLECLGLFKGAQGIEKAQNQGRIDTAFGEGRVVPGLTGAVTELNRAARAVSSKCH